jgi:hydrogenase expression/formation protein HypE
MKSENILLGHGSGGRLMHELVESLFMKYFRNNILDAQTDSAVVAAGSDEIAFTTDSFVIDPLFFPGGDIGKLAVCGTVNDLSVSGAEPLYLSASFIIEEGFPLSQLEQIVSSMAAEAEKAGVKIVTGDTKVVNRGKCDRLFINTSGIGKMRKEYRTIGSGINVEAGDAVIINGTIGDHGTAVMNAREAFNFRAALESDCTCLNSLIASVLNKYPVRFMRDPTRGGVASALNELAARTGKGIELFENSLPVKPEVKAMCEILGFDPLHVANEGKVLMVVKKEQADEIVAVLKKDEAGKDAAIIGEVTDAHPGKVILRNSTGGRRFVDTLSGDQLPRIC